MQKAYEFDFVYDTQAAFRLLLEALSNPGRIVEPVSYTHLTLPTT